MGKYRDHRERRGKRHGNDQDAFFGQASEPSYFQDTPSTEPDAIDAELLWFNASKGFGFVKLSDGADAYLHIRVLEAAGLLRREVQWRRHLCHLEPAPLRQAQAELAFYEHFWTTRLDTLEQILRGSDPASEGE